MAERPVFAWLCLSSVCLVASCLNQRTEPTRTSVLGLVERFPAAAELMAGARSAPPVRTADGFAIHSARPRAKHGSDWRMPASGMSVEIAESGASMRVVPERGGAFGARRIGPTPKDVSTESGAVVVRGESGAIDAAVFAREDGVEELFWVREGGPRVGYELDLPAGWTLKQPKGWPGLVEIRDRRDRPRARVVARKAWDETGAPVSIETSLEGNRILFAAGASARGDVLIDPEWQGTATLNQTRMRATATLLPTGKVLVVGGEAAFEGEVICSSELYDPLDASFEAGPVIPGDGEQACTPLMDHVAVPLPTGEVLIAGGANRAEDPDEAKALAKAWLYDPRTATFTAIDPMGTARVHHTATPLPDGKILVAGGGAKQAPLQESNLPDDCGAPMNVGKPCPKCVGIGSAELYDPATKTFAPVDGRMQARACHTATPLPDGRVLFVGGGDEHGNDIAHVTLYDGVFTELTSTTLNEPRHGHVAMLVSSTPGQTPPTKLFVALGVSEKSAIDPKHPTKNVVAEVLDTTDLANPFQALTVPPCDPPVDGCVVGRGYPAATLLPNGRVLIAGGQEDANSFAIAPSAQADVFDPVTDTFTSAGPLVALVRKPVFVALPTGSHLLVGETAPIQLYDDHVLAEVPSSPDMSFARQDFAATTLQDGRVLIVGGRGPEAEPDGIYGDTELFDPITGSQALPPLSQPRFNPTATLLADGRVLIVGGTTKSPGAGVIALNTAEIYDPKTSTFTPTASMSQGRIDHVATLLADGRVLVTGGFETAEGGAPNLLSAELYDPASGSWSPTGNMTEARCDHTASLLFSGKVLVAGGYTNADTGPNGAHASAEIYDPATNAFSRIEKSMGAARSTHSAAVLPDGRVLLAGGASTASDIFDPDTNEFELTLEPLSTNRFDASSVVLPSGKVVITGGLIGNEFAPSIEVYDPVTSTFEVFAMAQGRRYHQTVLLPSGDVLVLGGDQSPAPANDVLKQTTRFVETEPLVARPEIDGAPAAVIPGQTYEVTGQSLVTMGDNSGAHSSPNGFPVAVWLPIAGAPSLGAFAPWSATGATWTPFASPAPGPGWLFAVTSGVRSANGVSVSSARAPLGVPCEADAACESGFCRDGVCCDTGCHEPSESEPQEFTCRACSAAKKGSGEDGVCGPVAGGTDPQNDCTVLNECPEVTGACNATGACTVCTSKECSGDHSLIVTDANGASHVEDCGEYRCDAEARECKSRCKSKLDCAEGHACTADGLCAPPPEIVAGGCSMHTPAREKPAPLALLVAAGLVLQRRRRSRA